MPSSNPKESTGRGPPNNFFLKRLIDAKSRWSYSPDGEAKANGFLGWHERGYLPHFDAPNVTQFVTFMLHDAFPANRRSDWESILNEPDHSLRKRKLEHWLDRGAGNCWLRREDIATEVEEIIRSEDTRSYCLRAWTVMPNHIHIVVDIWQTPLSKLLNLWKGRSSRKANQLLGRTGPFWEREYFDTLIKDHTHLQKAIRYIENNPTKAKFVRDSAAWQWSSARWRDEYGRLPSEQ